MPLNKFEAYTDGGLMASFPLQNSTSGIVVEDVQGLDPVVASIVSSSYATLDGEEYQSSKTGKRNIVIKLGLQPDTAFNGTVEQLREYLEQWFAPKSSVRTRWYRDGKNALDIQGRVESMIAPLFAADPTATISIICVKSDFIDPTPVVVTGSTVSTTVNANETYGGTSDAGGVFALNVNRTCSGFTIYNTRPDGVVQALAFTYALVSGDVVTISSVPGNKYVRLTRGGVTTDILYAKDPTAPWITYTKGINQFRVQCTGAAIPWTFTYSTRYGSL